MQHLQLEVLFERSEIAIAMEDCKTELAWDQCLLRHRDRIYGETFHEQVTVMNIKEVLSAPRSPCQRADVERAVEIRHLLDIAGVSSPILAE